MAEERWGIWCVGPGEPGQWWSLTGHTRTDSESMAVGFRQTCSPGWTYDACSMPDTAKPPEHWGIWCYPDKNPGLGVWYSKSGDGVPIVYSRTEATDKATERRGMTSGEGWTYLPRPLPSEPLEKRNGFTALSGDVCGGSIGRITVTQPPSVEALARALFATDPRVRKFAIEQSEVRSRVGETPSPDAITADPRYRETIERAWKRGHENPIREPEADWCAQARMRAGATIDELKRLAQ
jgi:hypothetical protein